MSVCWHDGKSDHYHSEPSAMLFRYGRCRSGKRWFWAAECYDWRASDETVTLHGWAGTEDGALQDARSAIESAATGRPASAYTRHGAATSVLKSVNAAKRRAKQPSGETGTRVAEYLYEPWSYWDDFGETHKGISEITVVKKTAKRIYYNRTSRRDREDGVVTLGYISREEFETDTRCRDLCPVDAPVTRCGSHRLIYPHCLHVDVFRGRWKAQYGAHREGCADPCPLEQSVVCREHGYTWEHCPHGQPAGRCLHGYPAGQASRPGGHWWDYGGVFFATREAAEEYLYSREREQEREPELKRLRREMVEAHPDRGGSHEAFIAAERAYAAAAGRR
jgi:hypothetical protein